MWYNMVIKFFEELTTLDDKIRELREAGMSLAEIAREVGRPESTVSKHLRRLGYGSAAARRDVTSEAVLAAWNEGLRLGEIAERFGCSYETVERRLRDAGVVRKSRKSAGDRVMGADKFVERARSVHGSRYDYSCVQYVNSKTKVEIVCPAHGPFWQTPEKHLIGRGCPHRECVNAKIAATNLRTLGVERPLQSEDVRAEVRATNLSRYGVEHATQSPEIQARRAATFEARYGVSCNLRSPDAVAAIEAKYGGPSPFCSPEVRARARESMLSRYGVDNPMRVDEFKAKFCETCESRYGSRWPLSSPEIRERIHATMLERYGVEYSFSSGDLREKSAATCASRFGSQNPMQFDSVRAAQRSTMTSRYGVESSFQSGYLRDKARATCVERYGGPNPMCSREVVNRVLESKSRNGTFHTSRPEDALYEMLVGRFGVDDVVRQYRAPEYDFACDFYIKSRNLRVELNASWTHGGHWFDASDAEDAAVLATWASRAASSDYYNNAIHVWTDADVRKREAARAGGLNYVVFWDNELRDAAAWFERGCPDGRDWDEPWSWFEDGSGEATGT